MTEKEEQMCEESTTVGIQWSAALHEGFDKQRCPDAMHGLSSSYYNYDLRYLV